MKLTEAMEKEIRLALIDQTKIRKMTRWDALNFIAGYTNSKIELDDAMLIVNFVFACDLIKA
jgi:hypothetical protein